MAVPSVSAPQYELLVAFAGHILFLLGVRKEAQLYATESLEGIALYSYVLRWVYAIAVLLYTIISVVMFQHMDLPTPRDIFVPFAVVLYGYLVFIGRFKTRLIWKWNWIPWFSTREMYNTGRSTVVRQYEGWFVFTSYFFLGALTIVKISLIGSLEESITTVVNTFFWAENIHILSQCYLNLVFGSPSRLTFWNQQFTFWSSVLGMIYTIQVNLEHVKPFPFAPFTFVLLIQALFFRNKERRGKRGTLSVKKREALTEFFLSEKYVYDLVLKEMMVRIMGFKGDVVRDLERAHVDRFMDYLLEEDISEVDFLEEVFSDIGNREGKRILKSRKM